MEENNKGTQQNSQDEIRDDLRQKDEGGKDSTRTGSTNSDVLTSEWKPGDAEHHRTENPEAHGGIDSGTAGKGGDYVDR